MTRLALRSVFLRDFGCFASQELAFRGPEVLLVQGLNRDTMSGSGCGKSRFLRALAYVVGVLGAAGKPHVRWGAESMEVALTLAGERGEVTIRRGTAGLALGHAPVDPGAAGRSSRGKEAEADLRQLLGLPRECLEALTYRRQKSRGFLLSKTPGQQQDFLRQVLGLETYTAVAERAADRARQGQAAVVAAAERVRDLATRIDSLAADRARQPKPDPGAAEDLDLAVRAAQVGAEVLDGLRRELANARECFEPPSLGPLNVARAGLAAAEAAYAVELARVRRQRADGLAILKVVRGHREQLDAAIRAGGPALADLEAMAAARCPTCDQPWIPAEAKADRLFAVAEAAEAARREMPEVLQIEDAATACASLPDPTYPTALATEVRRLENVCAGEEAVLVEEIEHRVDGALDRRAAMLAVADQIRYRAERWADDRRREAEIEDVRGQLRAAVLAAEQAETEAAEAADALDALRGWLVEVLAEVLADVAERASRFMAAIPNVANCAVAMRTGRQLRDGGERAGVHVVVLIDGEERTDDDLSGGMQSATELAVDLAVAEVVAARTGSFPGWMVFDEPFDGMTIVEREAAMSLLRDFAERMGAVVFVVDHAAELKSAAEDGLFVEMVDKVATVRYLSDELEV